MEIVKNNHEDRKYEQKQQILFLKSKIDNWKKEIENNFRRCTNAEMKSFIKARNHKLSNEKNKTLRFMKECKLNEKARIQLDINKIKMRINILESANK
mmetsp:Transcript_32426/g.28713  ORF Transcript_32426/g.28713 Transcript_32426/m.28713 type:complete len:98 (-) Transcript_32426:28-321(-)